MALSAFWTRSFFVVGVCLLHGRMFSNIFGLYPLDASSPYQVVITTNVSTHCQMYGMRGKITPAESQGLNLFLTNID